MARCGRRPGVHRCRRPQLPACTCNPLTAALHSTRCCRVLRGRRAPSLASRPRSRAYLRRPFSPFSTMRRSSCSLRLLAPVAARRPGAARRWLWRLWWRTVSGSKMRCILIVLPMRGPTAAAPGPARRRPVGGLRRARRRAGPAPLSPAFQRSPTESCATGKRAPPLQAQRHKQATAASAHCAPAADSLCVPISQWSP